MIRESMNTGGKEGPLKKETKKNVETIEGREL